MANRNTHSRLSRGSESGFTLAELDEPVSVDQRQLYEGNSILRGGVTPRVDD